MLGSIEPDVGKNPLVVRLLKGIYQQKPPVARYNTTWDPSVVLSHFEATASRKLTVLQLARKTVTLLALTTLLRGAELASIKFDSFFASRYRATFVLGQLRKSQRTGPLQSLTVRAWRDNSIICPVTTLESYIERTETLRGPMSGNALFIGSNKPHRPVTASTVGHWIKEQLREAGIDTNVFSAHSTRGAAASHAASVGVPIATVLAQGHWASESTFARFYHRTVSANLDLVGQAVLRGQGSDGSPVIVL